MTFIPWWEINLWGKKYFNETVVKEYFNKKIDLDDKKFDNSLLIDPYYMEKL